MPFFLRSIEIATKKPSQDSIKAIYTLVSNGYDHLAELLTPAQKIQFRDRMAGFINTADRSILLLALATLACIGNFLEGNDVATSIVSEDHRQTRGNKDFFHGKKAMKLLQLVTNLAIDLASKDSNEYDDIVEELRLATVIVAAVGDEVKDALPSSKDILNTAKLLEKAQRPGLDERVLKEVSRTNISHVNIQLTTSSFSFFPSRSSRNSLLFRDWRKPLVFYVKGHSKMGGRIRILCSSHQLWLEYWVYEGESLFLFMNLLTA